MNFHALSRLSCLRVCWLQVFLLHGGDGDDSVPCLRVSQLLLAFATAECWYNVARCSQLTEDEHAGCDSHGAPVPDESRFHRIVYLDSLSWHLPHLKQEQAV